jgi:hypothetical protein
MTTCASLSFLLNTTLFGSRLMMIDGSGAEDKDDVNFVVKHIIQQDNTD